MFDKNKVNKDYDKYTMVELIYMVSQKCRSMLNSKRGCTDCEFLNCNDECCLYRIDEDFLPADWTKIEVEQEETNDDYYELSPAMRKMRYLEERYENDCYYEEGGVYPR